MPWAVPTQYEVLVKRKLISYTNLGLGPRGGVLGLARPGLPAHCSPGVHGWMGGS